MNILKYIGYVITVLICVVPFILYIIYLKKQNKTVEFTPEFKVKKIETSEDINNEVLTQGLNKVKGVFKLND